MYYHHINATAFADGRVSELRDAARTARTARTRPIGRRRSDDRVDAVAHRAVIRDELTGNHNETLISAPVIRHGIVLNNHNETLVVTPVVRNGLGVNHNETLIARSHGAPGARVGSAGQRSR